MAKMRKSTSRSTGYTIPGQMREGGTFLLGTAIPGIVLQDTVRQNEDEVYARKMTAWKRRLAEIRAELDTIGATGVIDAAGIIR